MTLKDLFEKVKLLNNINLELGVEVKYGIKVSAYKPYESLDCYDTIYTDLQTFIKAVEEESYYIDIDTAVLDLFETASTIEDLEFKTTFKGITNGFREEISSDVYIYIMKI